MILALHHIGISTPDKQRLGAFYRLYFGFERVSEFSWAVDDADAAEVLQVKRTAGSAVVMRKGPIFLELLQFDLPVAKLREAKWHVSDHGISHICFQVDDCLAEYERLRDAGMQFHCVPKDDPSGGKFVYGRDPDGNVIELWEIPMSENTSLIPHADVR